MWKIEFFLPTQSDIDPKMGRGRREIPLVRFPEYADGDCFRQPLVTVRLLRRGELCRWVDAFEGLAVRLGNTRRDCPGQFPAGALRRRNGFGGRRWVPSSWNSRGNFDPDFELRRLGFCKEK
jgi:hypothetical protein